MGAAGLVLQVKVHKIISINLLHFMTAVITGDTLEKMRSLVQYISSRTKKPNYGAAINLVPRFSLNLRNEIAR